jgi:tetratricopeptide (TPR) repeat protein
MNAARAPRAADDAVHALLARARALADRDPAAALAILDAERHDDAGLDHHARAALCLRLGRLDDAVAAAERATSLLPDVVDVRANLGAALLQRARGLPPGLAAVAAAAARDVLAAVVAQGPRFADAGAALVLAHELGGDPVAAVAAADENLRRFPGDAVTTFNKASALRAAGRVDEARAILQALVDARPDFVPAVAALRRLAR